MAFLRLVRRNGPRLGLVRAELRGERSHSTPETSLPALEVDARSMRNQRWYRARLNLGRRRYADSAHVAQLFTQFVADLFAGRDGEGGIPQATSWTDSAGNAVVELSDPRTPLSSSLVSGLFAPRFEVYASEMLEEGRAIPATADLVLSIDVWVDLWMDGGTTLRVVMDLDPMRNAKPSAPATEVGARTSSGTQLRDAPTSDIEEALAFLAKR